MFNQFAHEVLVQQKFRQMNRGDMYVPGGEIKSGTSMGVAASPKMGKPSPVASVPVTYSLPTAEARVKTPVGRVTVEASIQ